MCVSEAVSTFSTSSHCSFFFPEKKGLDIAFHKTNKFCLLMQHKRCKKGGGGDAL